MAHECGPARPIPCLGANWIVGCVAVPVPVPVPVPVLVLVLVLVPVPVPVLVQVLVIDQEGEWVDQFQ